ncbi:ANGL2-like protein [Mya arenaria]|uniref:ANGL2-like protein n=1 Tax=Mya arenaria TaxID=6604 RepID=A0ABY7DYW1_MYAAR|nr:fibrinogen-like protein 1 [Mya arenaria]WAR01855.1 ANGL2-like protein [Mya arenaria]
MKMTLIFALVLTLLTLEVGKVYSQQTGSICTTLQYRSLPPELQNEHQCMILERLQEDFADESKILKTQYENLYNLVNQFQTEMYRSIANLRPLNRDSVNAIPTLRDVPLVRDCDELYRDGITKSGVYPIRLPDRRVVNIWCDMETANGGWTIIQRRIDGSINFTRKWEDYAFGFGNANTEFWLGNENLYKLSHFKNYTLRIDLWDWDGNQAYAEYDTFRVESEEKQYALRIGEYQGTAGDALFPYHNNMKFSTIDEDNDEWTMNCALKDQAGWWYKACGFSTLNGLYIKKPNEKIMPDGVIRGIIWSKWKNDFSYSMMRVEMKIKPLMMVKDDRTRSKMPNSALGKEATTVSTATDTTSANTQQQTTETTTTDEGLIMEIQDQTTTDEPYYTGEYDDYDTV